MQPPGLRTRPVDGVGVELTGAVPMPTAEPRLQPGLPRTHIERRAHRLTSAPLLSFVNSKAWVAFVWPHTKLSIVVKSKMGAASLGHQLST
jgi:hypothetical protein